MSAQDLKAVFSPAAAMPAQGFVVLGPGCTLEFSLGGEVRSGVFTLQEPGGQLLMRNQRSSYDQPGGCLYKCPFALLCCVSGILRE